MAEEAPEAQQLMSPVDDENGDVSDEDKDALIKCPPETAKRFGNGLCFAKWCIPAFFFCVSAFISMWFLHIGTFYYVLQMERKEAIFSVNATALEQWNAANAELDGSSYLSPGVFKDDISYGSLQDPIEAALGFKEVDMAVLDKVSAFLPMTWFVVTILTDDLQHWTKVLTANCILAVGKGVFGFLTVVPDSSGWQNCKKRETEEGVARMKAEISSPKDGFWGVFWSTLNFELGIFWGKFTGEKGVRFCADMMYSGHTYFTCLYALGLVELVRMHTRRLGHKSLPRVLMIAGVMILCVGEQILEVTLVLQNRFHYTMDVFMAILLTMLIYTNGTVSVFAKWWFHWEPGQEDKEDELHEQRMSELPPEVTAWLEKNHHDWALVPKAEVRSEGDVWTPICCVPFCFFWGRTHLVSDKVFSRVGADAARANIFADDEDATLDG